MNLTLFNDFIIDNMKQIDKKKKLTDDRTLYNESISVNEQDSEILQIMQQKKEEKEALKKLLVNLNEPITNKRKHHK